MMELSGVTLLDDVPPHSGGFTIFPTSPQLLYPTSEQALNWVATEASVGAVDRLKAEVQPVEFTGRAGDTIFAHGLVVHTAGLHDTDRLRLAIIQDFNKVRPRSHMRWTAAGKRGGPRVHCDMDGVFRFATDGDDNPADGLREVTNQWIMDSNEFVLARDVPFDDMFHDWNLGRQPVRGHVVDEPPWWRKYGLPPMPSRNAPRGGGGSARGAPFGDSGLRGRGRLAGHVAGQRLDGALTLRPLAVGVSDATPDARTQGRRVTRTQPGQRQTAE